jgi:choline dehydrogenase
MDIGMDIEMDTDVLVIGAGTAGCVIARRLLDAGLSVVLIEAGDDTPRPAISDPVRMHELWDSSADWGYRTVPQEFAHERRLHLPRGKMVGGSHALNAMIWVRGHPADYDTWAYLGNSEWSWASVRPVFEQSEKMVDLVTAFEPHPVQRAAVVAARQQGLPFNPDYNSGRLDGVSYLQLTIRDGRRLTTAEAYLGPVLADPRLRLVTAAQVRRLTFDGTRCTGVEYGKDGEIEQITAARTVLCAGALGSPVILARSGVGDPDRSAALGLPVIAPLRGVGRNLQDHWLVPVVLGVDRPIDPLPGLPVCQSHLFWRSRPDLVVPDLQPLIFGVPLTAEWMQAPDYGITLMAGLVRPASRGSVQVTSPDPEVPPAIDPGCSARPKTWTAWSPRSGSAARSPRSRGCSRTGEPASSTRPRSGRAPTCCGTTCARRW